MNKATQRIMSSKRVTAHECCLTKTREERIRSWIVRGYSILYWVFLWEILIWQQHDTHSLVWTSGKVRTMRSQELALSQIDLEDVTTTASSSSPTSTSTPEQPSIRRLGPLPKWAGVIPPHQDNLQQQEETERREMEWLVETTTKLLGTDSPMVGSMSRGMVYRTRLLMKTWSRRSGANSPYVVERILKRLLEEQDAGNEHVILSTMDYNILLNAWSKCNTEGSAERAEQILEGMERMYGTGNLHVRPDEDSYNAVIKAYVKNGNRSDSVIKAEALLDRMVKSSSSSLSSSSSSVSVTSQTFCSATTTAKSEGTTVQQENLVSPNRRGYNLFMYALAHSSFDDAPERVEKVLQTMKDGYAKGNLVVKPDINSYNQAIASWARGRQVGYEFRMQALFDEVLSLPSEIKIRPNTDTYNLVMGGWLKSNNRQALSNIEDVLQLMEQSYASGNIIAKPDRITLNTVIAAYAKNAQNGTVFKALKMKAKLEKKYNISADTISNNIVVDSWCKSGRSDAPERVMELLMVMERDFKRGNANLKPDSYTYCSVIDSFIKSSRLDAPQKAEGILQRMQDLHRYHGGDPPTTSVFNAVINAWACSTIDSNLAVERAHAILQSMEQNYHNNTSIARPNRVSYNTVIKAMRHGNAEEAARAEKFLTILEERSQHDEALTPDAYSYSAVITSYGRSDDPNKAQNAFAVLQRMIQAYKGGNQSAKPIVHSFNAALNACAFVTGDASSKDEAFSIVQKILSLMKGHVRADHTTYGTILRACSSLLSQNSEQRKLVVEETFQRACREGQVGKLVLTQLRFAATPEQYQELIGSDRSKRVHLEELPVEWTCNVRELGNRKLPSF